MKIILINFIDIDNDNEFFTMAFKDKNNSFNFDKFYNDLEKLHEKNEGQVSFDSEIDLIVKKHNLILCDFDTFEYKY